MRSRILCASTLWLGVSAALAQPGGIAPEWEVRKQMAALAGHLQRIQPVLEQLKPVNWVEHGAPAAYVEQWRRASAEIGYLSGSAQALAEQPEKLTAALDAFLRMQSLDVLLGSITAGARKYQNPAVADLLQGLINDTAADRDRLRQYLIELAADREQQFKIVDQEAQRCRAFLSRQPGAPATSTPGKEVRR